MSYFKYQNKNVYFMEIGEGKPVIFLHGNTGSSKMFEALIPAFKNSYKMILIDFLGNGQSERINHFPVDLWYDEALQTLALINHLGYEKVSLVGTSGGSYVAINVALEYPNVVHKIVADSFDGRTLHEGFLEALKIERAACKENDFARKFYEWCQGDNWEQVVDADTQAVSQFIGAGLSLYHKPIEELKVPMLLMGSKEDTSLRKNLKEEYEQIVSLITKAKIHMFEKGGHPAMLSNAEEAVKIIKEWL